MPSRIVAGDLKRRCWMVIRARIGVIAVATAVGAILSVTAASERDSRRES